MLIEFELDIPSLTQQAIQMGSDSFERVKVLQTLSMIEGMIMTEMLILLIDSFDRRVVICSVLMSTTSVQRQNDLIVDMEMI